MQIIVAAIGILKVIIFQWSRSGIYNSILKTLSSHHEKSITQHY